MNRGIATEQFVKVWMQAWEKKKDLDWIAARLGRTKSSVSNNAHRLKEAGVNLPRLYTLDVDRLNKMIKEKVDNGRSSTGDSKDSPTLQD